MPTEPRREFWETFLRAVETCPHDVGEIKGASGLVHPVVALGTDEDRRRLVVVSAEPGARAAALAQADIQAAVAPVQVVMARTAPVNLAIAAEALSELCGSTSWGTDQFQRLREISETPNAGELGEVLRKRLITPIKVLFELVPLNTLAYWQEVIQQLALVRFDPSTPSESNATERGALHMDSLVALDPVEQDRRHGVCSVPLYALQIDELAMFVGGAVDASREILRKHDVLQYFFPPPDHLALALSEANRLPLDALVEQLKTAPSLGHPFGAAELVSPDVRFNDLLSVLEERGFLVDGEVGYELTSAGHEARTTVRFKPRESLLAKVVNRFSVSIDINLRDLKNVFRNT